MLIVAESVSALKRTLARILVLIVAVGFGYVKCAHSCLWLPPARSLLTLHHFS